MTDDQIKSMLADVAIYERSPWQSHSPLGSDLCCHVKELACYVEELQAQITLLSTPEDTSVLGGLTEFRPKERAARLPDRPIDISDIVNRLRDYDACRDSDVDEAANEIERLRNHVSSLAAELKRQRQGWITAFNDYSGGSTHSAKVGEL